MRYKRLAASSKMRRVQVQLAQLLIEQHGFANGMYEQCLIARLQQQV
jgi:hypothetical protein